MRAPLSALLAMILLVSSTVRAGEPEIIFANGFEQAFSVGGVVSGLQGSGMVLRLNNSQDLAITADGPFVFSQMVEQGEPYLVQIDTQPGNPMQTCALARASGVIVMTSISDVVVSCGANWDEFNWDEENWN